MGFEKMPENEVIETVFNSIRIYSVEHMRIDELIDSQTQSFISYKGKNYEFAFGNNINSILDRLLGMTLPENEYEWQKANELKPPYFVIHFKDEVSYSCCLGYWQRIEGYLLTYDCFTEAKQSFKNFESQIIQPLIMSLTIKLSNISESVKFTPINHDVYGVTNGNDILVDMKFEMEVHGVVEHNASLEELEIKMNEATELFPSIDPKVASLYTSGIIEEDELTKFMSLFQSLEIHIKKTYENLNGKLKSPTLGQRLKYCVKNKWLNLNKSDIDNFYQIKDIRDSLAHGKDISIETVHIKIIKDLLFKILN